jgi:hypothetical protein
MKSRTAHKSFVSSTYAMTIRNLLIFMLLPWTGGRGVPLIIVNHTSSAEPRLPLPSTHCTANPLVPQSPLAPFGSTSHR